MSLLLSRSKDNRIEFCKVFEIFPVKGRLILNKIPASLVKEDAKSLLTKLRDANFASNRMLYLSSYNENTLPLEHRDFPDDSFLDPFEAVIMVQVED